MNGAESIAAAVIFTWLGMVLAISFLEAPLKFRAPGVTLQIGLGIGGRPSCRAGTTSMCAQPAIPAAALDAQPDWAVRATPAGAHRAGCSVPGS